MVGFDIDRTPLAGAPRMALSGEVDMATASELELAFDEAVRESVGAFVVDLCDLEFLDSSGIRVLLHLRALLARSERQLVLVCPPGPVLRVIELAGVSDLFVLYATAEDAARALVPADGV